MIPKKGRLCKAPSLACFFPSFFHEGKGWTRGAPFPFIKARRILLSLFLFWYKQIQSSIGFFHLERDGYLVQEYRLHVLKTLFAEENLI